MIKKGKTGGKLGVAVLCLLLAGNVPAQSYQGITNVADTGYSNQSAYRHSVKEYPGITLVQLADNPLVKQDFGVVYSTIGKRKLALDVFSPKTLPAAVVAFIMVHGGGWRSGNRAQHHPLAEALAAKGYVCFTPEYRLSTEALFPAGVYDIKAAIRWVKANANTYHIDTNKIVIAGFSAGGELAAFMGATGNMPLFAGVENSTFTTNVQAVVDLDGTLSFTHPESSEGDDSRSISAGTYWFGYSRKENIGLWNAASPLTYVSGKTPPTLFVNSSIDRMHAGREDYLKVLNEAGIYTEVHTFEASPHSFPLFEPWFTPTVNYIDGFLRKVFAK